MREVASVSRFRALTMTGVSHVFQSAKATVNYSYGLFLFKALLFMPFLARFVRMPALTMKKCPQPIMPDPRATMTLLAGPPYTSVLATSIKSATQQTAAISRPRAPMPRRF